LVVMLGAVGCPSACTLKAIGSNNRAQRRIAFPLELRFMVELPERSFTTLVGASVVFQRFNT